MGKRDLRVGVVCGGGSPEAEVSRVSGREVANAARAAYPATVLLELDASIAGRLRDERIDVVFPALHGPPGEDGCFQGLLEILGIPYVGSGVLASACAMDKTVAKHIFAANGLPTPRGALVRRGEDLAEACERLVGSLGSRLVVKPDAQGSALGVVFVEGAAELGRALEATFSFGEAVLVEERIAGREITVAVLERERTEALPVIEVRTPEGSWYDYEHRYTPGLSEHVIPAPLPKDQYEETQDAAVRAFESLGCRDFARVDFVVPETGTPRLIEVNTLPGMTPTSLFPDAAEAVGVGFVELVAGLVARAAARGSRRA